MTKSIFCEMSVDCKNPLARVDVNGYVYCEKHGLQRKAWKHCRKLTAKEVAKLKQGLRIPYSSIPPTDR